MNDMIIELLKKNFNNIESICVLNKNEIYVEVDPEDIPAICKFIYFNIECSLVSLFAGDERALDGCFSVYYAFALKKVSVLLIIKVKLSGDNLRLQSITSEIPAANLYEREIRDLFGIQFDGHPDEREFVFHGNWPSALHPLKKDFKASEKPEFVPREEKFLRIEGAGVFEIPVGPVHAGIIEPGHFRFSVAGEPIINLEAKLYYVHKGIEKLSENSTFEKVLFISERISGDETVANSLAYCLALEKIAGLEGVPERAEYTRTILCELERVYNHLGDIAGICIDVAYSFAAYQFNMMRRWCMIWNEEITGSRYLRSSIRPGGIRREMIRGKEKSILANMDKLEKEFNETVDIIKSNSLFIDRVENTGVVKANIAYDLNAVGPGGRCASIKSDVRKDYPYAAYEKIDFEIPVHHNGDVNCRMNVKIEELRESIRIIRQAVEKMPENGEAVEPVIKLPPYTFSFGLTEAPRGENCHWIMTGEDNTIFRYKIRTPSFCNWPVLCYAVKGNIVPDFPLINKSFNLSYAGNDL